MVEVKLEAYEARLTRLLPDEYHNLTSVVKSLPSSSVFNMFEFHILQSEQRDALFKEVANSNFDVANMNVGLCVLAVERGVLTKEGLLFIMKDLNKRHTLGPVRRPLSHILTEAKAWIQAERQANVRLKRAKTRTHTHTHSS